MNERERAILKLWDEAVEIWRNRKQPRGPFERFNAELFPYLVALAGLESPDGVARGR